jgi:hypothetical protein
LGGVTISVPLTVVPRLRAARYIGPTPGGGSGSHFFEDDQGGRHVVKFQENPQGLRVLINELAAGQVAAYLRVPCPEVAVIDVDQWLIDASPGIRARTPNAKGGLHFAARDVPGTYASAPRALIAQVENTADFPVVIVFDTLTMNTDRVNDGNFLIQTLPSGGTRFWAIDHGHCFGHTWDASLPSKAGTNAPTFFSEMLPSIAGSAPFDGSLALAAAMTDAQLDHVVAQIPPEWAVPAHEAAGLRGFLRSQSGALPGIFTNHKALFPLWK